MNGVITKPDSEEHWLSLRDKNINSSEVAALFGLSPYMTRYKLWAQKSGKVGRDNINSERIRHGSRMERAIAETVMAETLGAVPPDLLPFKDYIEIPEHRIGSSFDMIMGDDLVEVKNVDSFVYAQQWIEGEAPPHIELQAQHQMLVSGRSTCHICALVGGNKAVRIKRDANPKIHEKILARCIQFWVDVDEGREPERNMDKDHSVISQMYKEKAVIGKVAFLDGGPAKLAMEYVELGATIREAKKRQDIIKALLKDGADGATELSNEAMTVKLLPRFSIRGTL